MVSASALVDQTPDSEILASVVDDMAHCPVPVRADLAEAHALVLTRLAMPGEWWSGAERIAIAAQSRTVYSCNFCSERKAALSPYAVDGTHKTDPIYDGVLPVEIIDILHLAMTDPTRMTASAIARLSDAGLSDAHYVEALGIGVALRSIDQACRGLGVPLHQMPHPVPGEPRRIRPEVEPAGDAFVAMMPPRQPAPPNDDLWDENSIYYGLRAMSLVPDAVRDLRILSAAQYIPLDKASDFTHGRSLSREQLELLAGRVSAINDCFY
ncbi:MAG: alkylhydroperoxidase-related (seleno)protein [Alphaproteobacteria bacterium]